MIDYLLQTTISVVFFKTQLWRGETCRGKMFSEVKLMFNHCTICNGVTLPGWLQINLLTAEMCSLSILSNHLI